MTERKPYYQQASVTRLNATPLSQHLASLLRQEGVSPEDHHLTLVDLLLWMVEHHYPNQLQGELEVGAVSMAAHDDPEAVYQNLVDDRMLQATTLDEAAQVMVASLTELLD